MTDFCYLYLSEPDISIPEDIVILYPYSLSHEKILIENLKHVPEYLYQIIDLTKEYEVYSTARNRAVFDIEKSKYSNMMSDIQTKIDTLRDKMNEDLSPYAWFVKGNINTYIDQTHIKTDWCCVLEKI